MTQPLSSASSVVSGPEGAAAHAAAVERGKAGTPGNLFSLIKSDLTRKADWCYGGGGLKNLLKVLLTDGSFAMVMYRCMQWSGRWKLIPLEMFFNKANAFFGQCIIGRGAQFGPGFVLIHSQGVVINGAVKGGCNISLEHQVTIGAERGLIPLLGDNIFIGAGAKVVGPVNIGSGAKVGANAVVVHDVPENTTVVGIPARPVRSRSTQEASSPESAEDGST